jgi:hypothetical protein
MKTRIVKRVLPVWFLLITVLFAGPATSALPTEWFDQYGQISWAQERIRLDNFAYYLSQNPEMIGYVAVIQGKRESNFHLQRRITRLRGHLVRSRNVDPKNLVIIRVATKKNSQETILQPIDKASATVDFEAVFKGRR